MPPSSSISSEAVSSAQPEPEIIIRYAAGDDDIIAIHRFVMVVSKPQARAPIDHMDSATEIWRVVNEEAALMAIRDGIMVGTIGLMAPKWWYNKKASFMTDRWYAILPQYRHTQVENMLLTEAQKTAQAAGLELIINGKSRERKLGDRPIVYQLSTVLKS